VLGWRKLLGLGLLDTVLFLLSGATARSVRHLGTLSNVLWVDFLLGVLLLVVLLVANAIRSAVALRR
jgi:hypothetical protein